MTRNFNGFEVIDRPLPDPTDDEIRRLNRKHGWSIPIVQKPNRAVVHAMSEQIRIDRTLAERYSAFRGREGDLVYAATFLEGIGRSAHMLVASGGEPIRCRQDDQIAWHARGFNVHSLGVEILVPGAHDYGTFLSAIAQPGWVGEQQFETAVEIVRFWMERWRFDADSGDLDRHSDLSPGRKHDPGDGFDWQRFVGRVSA